ncbi:MAG: hypothetical protein K2Q12_00180 [Rickettsiales bacterium]|nr:hypothetical protein [Rickettsiales bacterium]
MAINLQDFVKQRNASHSDATQDAQAKNPMLSGDDALKARIDQLLADVMAGKEGADLDFAALLEDVPEDKRGDVIAQMRARMAEMEAEPTFAHSTMTPQEEAMLQQLKTHEQSIIAHLLHEKTLEKIRRIFMLNPALWEQVTGISEQLQRRGVLTELQRVNAEKLGDIAARPGQNPQHKKGTEKDR